MRLTWMRSFQPLFDAADAGGGGGAASAGGQTGATPPASSGGTSGGSTSGAGAGSTGAASPGSGTASGSGTGTAGFTYKEDRSNWVPSHVIRERTQKAEAERQKLERELFFERQRVAALSGVTAPKPPANPEHEEIRRQLLAVVPQLEGLLNLDPEKLNKLTAFDFEALQRANQETSERIWKNHGRQAINVMSEKVKAMYGADTDPKYIKRVLNAFAAEASEDPQMTARYEAGDFTVIDEFLDDWSKGFVEPIRKASSAPTPGQQAARRLPRAGGGSASVGQRPPTLKPSDPGYHEAAAAAFMKQR